MGPNSAAGMSDQKRQRKLFEEAGQPIRTGSGHFQSLRRDKQAGQVTMTGMKGKKRYD
jgi:hypothetical protein